MGGASICDQADQGLHHSTVTLVGGLNIDVACQCDWSIVSWLAMTICEGVRVMVEINGVIANVAGFDKADKRGLTRQTRHGVMWRLGWHVAHQCAVDTR